MSKRRTRQTPTVRTPFLTEGRPRYKSRRRPPISLLAAVVVVLAVLVGAIVIAGNGTGSGRRSDPQSSANLTRSSRRARRKAGATRAQRPNQDSRAIAAVLRYTPFIARGTSRRRVIALSFDDGPSPYTEGVVRVLVRMNVRVTFFVVGQQLTYFSAGLRDELRHGFDIGDHTENHAWLIRLSAAAQYAQIHDAAVRMERLGAPAPLMFRPPYGAYDGQTLAILRRMGMMMVMWSIDPGDWRRPGVNAIVGNVLANARPGAIVIMHDGGGDRSQTIAALPAIIRGLRRRHYGLVTVPQLLALDPPPRHQRLPGLGGA